MNFEELVQSIQLTEEQISAITSGMQENGIFLSAEENIDLRYHKLKEEKDSLSGQVSTLTKTVNDLKKNNQDNEELQTTIQTLQETLKQQQEDSRNAAKAYELKDALKGKGVLDADYLIYKAGGLEHFNFDAENHPIGLDEMLAPYRKDAAMAHLFQTEPNKQAYHPNGGNGGAGVRNPFAKETRNLTEQGKMLRENPEQARAMAAAAGVKL